MKYDQFIEAIADAAINAGMFVRCAGYACIAFCVVAPAAMVVL
jgi:hypothetical protein